ncbi:MAG: MATE family efflux transporter [Clostridiales bacterium]|nr:MATE family efflux transporter [Clostridiales bacterium]
MMESDAHAAGGPAAKNDFSKGSVAGTIFRLALPMIGAQLINALYNIVDRIYIGRIEGIGRDALTGIGVTFPILMIVSAFTALCGQGGAPLCSIARGAGDKDRAERIMGNAFTLLVLSGVLVTAVGLIFKRPVLYLFGASDVTYPFANDYVTIYLCGSLFVMIGLGMNAFINAQGFAATGMLSVLIGAVLNILLDPLFIFAFGWGVRGAAVATVVSQAASAVWVLLFLTGRRTILRLRFRQMKLQWAIVRRILMLGLTGFFMKLTNSAVQVSCNATLQAFGGDLYVGVMTVVNSVREVLMMPVSGLSSGSEPFVSYNYGAGHYDRVRKGFRVMAAGCIIYSVCAWAAVEAVPALVIRIFNSEAELVQAGIPAVRIYFAAYWVLSLQMAGQSGFVALNRPKQAVFFSLLRKGIIVVPLVLLLPRLGLGTNGVFLAEPISDFIGSTACFTTFLLTVWPKLKTPDAAEAQTGKI